MYFFRFSCNITSIISTNNYFTKYNKRIPEDENAKKIVAVHTNTDSTTSIFLQFGDIVETSLYNSHTLMLIPTYVK